MQTIDLGAHHQMALEIRMARSWFNLDTTWAVSLVLVGALSLASGLAGTA